MPYKKGQPTLIDYLGTEPVTRLAKQRFFGGRYLRYDDHYSILAFIYESGAVIGRARCDKLSILEKMFEAPWLGPEPIKFSQEEAKERLDAFREEVGRALHSFLEFILLKEVENIVKLTAKYDMGQLIGKGPVSMSDLNHGVRKRWEKIEEALNKKVPLVSAEFEIRMHGREGIGFGGSFPELTERMYRNLNETTDPLEWYKGRAFGLVPNIVREVPVISLEEREDNILKIVAFYASEYYPELLDPLDLRGYLDVGMTC